MIVRVALTNTLTKETVAFISFQIIHNKSDTSLVFILICTILLHIHEGGKVQVKVQTTLIIWYNSFIFYKPFNKILYTVILVMTNSIFHNLPNLFWTRKFMSQITCANGGISCSKLLACWVDEKTWNFN